MEGIEGKGIGGSGYWWEWASRGQDESGFVLVGVDVGEDPADEAERSVGGGGLSEFGVVLAADVVLDGVGVADVVDDVADGIDCVAVDLQTISMVQRITDL